MTDLRTINLFAGNEGWGIFECYGSTDKRGNVTPFQLQSLGDHRDDQAWRHVVTMARIGSYIHKVALAWLRINSPTEYTQIIKYCDSPAAKLRELMARKAPWE